jgi:hypothetical protein
LALGNIPGGFSFSAQDSVTLEITPDSADTVGTHLSSSLKDLQKLGVDAVAIAGDLDGNPATQNNISLAMGEGVNFAGLPVFGDTNKDGVISAAEDNALNVTLDVQFSQLAEIASGTHETALANSGIDNIAVQVSSEAQLLSLLRNSSFEAELNAAHLNLAVDFGSGQVGINDLHISGIAGNANAITLDVYATTSFDLATEAGTSGTHLTTSLKDLQKLGVDAVQLLGIDPTNPASRALEIDMGTGAALKAQGLPMFGDTNRNGVLSKAEDDKLDVTLNLGATNVQDVASLAKALHDSGIDHLALNTSDFTPNQDLLSTLKWLESGLDLTLKVDNATPMLAGKTTNNLADIVDVLDGGLNLLSSTNLTPGETWGSLIQTLHDAGLGRIDIEKTASVHIHDELSAALYESGMLHALPQANVEIDAEGIKLLSTSLKAMADLGVDKVHTDAKVYLELGLRDAGLSELTDLFAAFGLNTPSDPAHELFANQGASLVLDKDTADNIGLGNAGGVSSTVLDLMGKLSKLGITQIDVVDPTAHTVTHEYNIVAQTPVEVAVHTLGADLYAVTHVFDTDILQKPVKG